MELVESEIDDIEEMGDLLKHPAVPVSAPPVVISKPPEDSKTCYGLCGGIDPFE